MNVRFESSTAGSLGLDDSVECGVCWWVYNPRDGAQEHDIQPGIAFSDLADDFRCPCCDAPKSKFMALAAGRPAHAQQEPAATMEERVAGLVLAFRQAEEAMIGLPVHNPKLDIEALGFQEFEDHYAGLVITPWCLNIILIPRDPSAMPAGPIGSKRIVTFPSGPYPFIAGHMDGFGATESCSLFSPMEMFDDQDVARQSAEAALEGLFTAPEPEPEKQVSRRNLFGRGA